MITPIDRLMDAQYCQRWSMVGTVIPSNVAVHSFNVAMIAMEIRKRMMNTIHFSEMEVCYFALIHDVKEVYTGDIPTPTKTKMRAAGFDPESFDPGVPDEMEPSPRVRQIVKMADLIDNAYFISRHGTGTRATTATAEVSRRLSDALAGADSDLLQAARATIDYIEERSSEQEDERRRLETEYQKLREMREFSRNPSAPYVGGKSLYGVGGT